ncbi:hypothetical protein Plhal304r1_c002g0008811 [Plasmopara halstedii]
MKPYHQRILKTGERLLAIDTCFRPLDRQLLYSLRTNCRHGSFSVTYSQG